jgi:hypothetical protein
MRDELKLSKILRFKTDYHTVQLIDMPRIYVLQVRYLAFNLHEVASFPSTNCCI